MKLVETVSEINLDLKVVPEKYENFKKHFCAYTKEMELDPRHIFYQFVPSGIGTLIRISCRCGKEEDITDYSSW